MSPTQQVPEAQPVEPLRHLVNHDDLKQLLDMLLLSGLSGLDVLSDADL